MAADGQVTITLDLEDNLSSELTKAIESSKSAGNKIEASAKESNNVIRQEAKKTREELNQQFGKETRIKLATEFDKAGVKNFDETLEKLPKEKQIELLTKADKGELIDVQKEIKSLPPTVKSEIELKDNASPEIKKVAALSKKDIHQKLVADADTHGIKNFDKLLKLLPKKTRTDLMARAEKGEVINYEKLLHKIPAKVVSKAELNDHASFSMRNITNESKNLQRQTEETSKGFSHFKGIVTGSFAGTLMAGGVSKAIATVTGSIGGAVDRLDTLNNATRAYGNMGIKAGDAKKANLALQKSIDGLPTSLQDATKSQQLLTSSMNNDVGKATNVYKALNDGIIGFGGSSEQVNEAVLQLSQSFSNGKVDAETWNSMLNAQMGPTLNAIAKKMHMTTGELKDNLSQGKISVSEFQNQLIEMDEKGGGGLTNLHKTAKDATSGIGTAFKNVNTRVVSSVASILSGLQKAGLSDYINDFGKVLRNNGKNFEAFGQTAGKFLPPVISTIKDFASITGSVLSGMAQPFIDIGKSIAGLVKSSSAMKGTSNVLRDLAKNKDALKTLGVTLGLVLTGILAFKAVSAVVTVFKSLRNAILLTKTAMGLLNIAMKSNAIGLIISVIATLVVAFIELYKHNAKFKKFIDGIAKGIGDFFKSAGKVIDKGIKSVQKAFKGVMNFFKKDWKEILFLIVNPFSGAFALLYKHNAKFKKGVDGVVKWIKTTLNKFGKWFSSTLSSFGKWLSKTWRKIWDPISDGFEDVFNFFVKIWNKWYKSFTNNLSAFSKWLSKTWHNIWDPVKDFYSDIWDDIKKIGKKAWDWIIDKLSGFGKSVLKTWHRLWNSVADFFGDSWNGIKKTGQRAWNWISDKLDDFGSNVSKGWHGLWNGLRDFFSDIWDDIKGLAKDGMNGVIGFINKGIGGINTIIHDFGGKKTTINPIGKFAQGTKGAPRGFAMVNDGFDSPTGQELIIDNQGRGTILEGRNQLVNFEGGETVVPAGVTHAMLNGKFANGTNDWFGGLKNFFGDAAEDIGDMMKKATGKAAAFFNIAKNPIGYIKDKIFSPVTEGINATKGSAIKALGNSFNSDGKGVQGNQNKWWKELWNMLKDTLSGGGKGGFGDDYLFKGHAKDDGSDPYGYFFRECVSFVASRLKNEGVNSKLFTGLGNGSDWGSAHVPHSSTPRVGDIAQYGPGSLYGNHVAVVTDVKGNKYREEGYNYNNNGKYYGPSRWLDASDASTFLRFPGAKGGKTSQKTDKKDSPLQKMIKKQVGGMFDWVSDMVGKLMPSFSGSDNQAPKGDHKNWLSQAGIKGDYDKWNYIISHESGWNPHAKNPGSDAYGIGQALPPSKMAAFGSDYMSNPITQLKWMQSYVNERYNGINGAYDFWRSHNWYANGGWGGNKIGIFNEVPGEEEVVINPSRPSADKLLLEASQETAKKQPNSLMANMIMQAEIAKSSLQSGHNINQPLASGSATLQNGNVKDAKNGDLIVEFNIDGQQMGRVISPIIESIHDQKTTIEANTMGLGGTLNYGI